MSSAFFSTNGRVTPTTTEEKQPDAPEYLIALITDSPHGVFVLQQSFNAETVVGAFNGVRRWRDENGAVDPVVFPAGINAARLFGTEQIDALRRDRNRIGDECRRFRRGSFAAMCACAVFAGVLGGVAGLAAARAGLSKITLEEYHRHAAGNGDGRVAEETPETGREGAGRAGAALGVERQAAGDGETLYHAGVAVVEGGRVRAVENPVDEKPMDERPRNGAPGVDIGESGIHGVVHAESVAEPAMERKNGVNAEKQEQKGGTE